MCAHKDYALFVLQHLLKDNHIPICVLTSNDTIYERRGLLESFYDNNNRQKNQTIDQINKGLETNSND